MQASTRLKFLYCKRQLRQKTSKEKIIIAYDQKNVDFKKIRGYYKSSKQDQEHTNKEKARTAKLRKAK